MTEWMTPPAAAKRIGVTANTPRAWADQGLVEFTKVQAGRRYQRRHVEALRRRMPPADWVTVSEAAAIMAVSNDTVRRWVEVSKLTARLDPAGRLYLAPTWRTELWAAADEREAREAEPTRSKPIPDGPPEGFIGLHVAAHLMHMPPVILSRRAQLWGIPRVEVKGRRYYQEQPVRDWCRSNRGPSD